MENKQQWYPVQYGPFWEIQSSPYYEDKVNLLSADDVGEEQAEYNAKLCAMTPELLRIVEEYHEELQYHKGSSDCSANIGHSTQQAMVIYEQLKEKLNNGK